MPTTLPTAALARPVPRLTEWQTARFFYLLARTRWLYWRMNAAHARATSLGPPEAGAAFLAAAHRWLDCHERIAALLDLPPPPHVAQVRAVLHVPPMRPGERHP